MPLESIARETLAILDRGWYESAGGRVSLAGPQQDAVNGTVLLTPADLQNLSFHKKPTPKYARPQYSVTRETTQEAAFRLARTEGVDDLVVLNFASARKIAGGFRRGAKAQEEDLARSSGLVRCLETTPQFYEENQASTSFLYTDNMIYSPRVPWFRATDSALLDGYFLASIISAPAPNAKEYLRSASADRRILKETILRRAGYILAVAESNGHGTLLLGAWGCGVFRNEPAEVAGAFMSQLKSRRFRNSFSRVVFAVFDPTKSLATYEAFKARVR